MNNNSPATVLVCFDNHSPYLAFRVSRLARALEDDGLSGAIVLRVLLLAHEDDTYGWNTEQLAAQYGGVPVDALSARLTRSGLRGYFQAGTLRSGWRFFRYLLRHRPRIVAIGGYERLESIIAVMTAWLFRWRVGVMLDSRFNDSEMIRRGAFTEALKSLVARRYHFFLCSGRECVDYVRFLAGPGRPAHLGAYDMVDNEALARAADSAQHDAAIHDHLGVEAGSPYFLAAIRFIEKKNTARLIEAYARYAQGPGRAIPLVICGKGPLESDYRAQIARLGLHGKVWLASWLDYAWVPRAARLSRGVILASTHDQWGLVVNEALAAGAPVLVSSRCGSHELVRNGLNGFTFHPWDIEHLAWLLKRLGEDDELQELLRAHARGSIERLSIEGFIHAFRAEFTRHGLAPEPAESRR